MTRVVAAAVLFLLVAVNASAANPGANGRIAFVRLIDWRSYTQDAGSIWTVGSDGSDARRLTRTIGGDRSPAWSPDGRRLAFARLTSRDEFTPGRDAHEIFVVNANGSGLRRLTRNHVYDGEPTWSPDGTRVAFVRGEDPAVTTRPTGDIWVMRSDGSRARRLTRTNAVESAPSWGPRGRSLAYLRRDLERRFGADGAPSWTTSERTDLWTMNADGSRPRPTGIASATFRLELPYATTEFLTAPDWSPDGVRVVLGTARGIAALRPNGDELELIETSCDDPAWSPDGRLIVCSRGEERARYIWALTLEGSARRVTSSPYRPEELTHVHDFDPAWQPVRRR